MPRNAVHYSNKRKINAEKLKIENDRLTAENERKEKELRKQAFLELIPEIKMSAIAAKPKPVDLEYAADTGNRNSLMTRKTTIDNYIIGEFFFTQLKISWDFHEN